MPDWPVLRQNKMNQEVVSLAGLHPPMNLVSPLTSYDTSLLAQLSPALYVSVAAVPVAVSSTQCFPALPEVVAAATVAMTAVLWAEHYPG